MGASMTEDARYSFQQRFLLGLVAAISVLFLWMIRHFLIPLLLAAIFAGLLQPLYRMVLRWLRGREALASATVVLLSLLLILGPLTGFLGIVVGQALEISQGVGPWVEEQMQREDPLSDLLQRIPFSDTHPWLQTVAPDRDELVSKVGQAVSRFGSLVVEGLASATRGTAAFLLYLFILLYSLFFFLMRGHEVLERALFYVPLTNEEEDALIQRFVSVTRATLKGSLVIGLLQGSLAGLGFWVAGIKGAAFWGTVMAVLSVIPGVGALIVWVPGVLWLLATGHGVAAAGLTAWCAGVVGTIDNVLRPRLVGTDAKMPDLLILLGTLGGISLFGASGFLLGPVVAALFVTLWEMYGRSFRELLPPMRKDAGA